MSTIRTCSLMCRLLINSKGTPHFFQESSKCLLIASSKGVSTGWKICHRSLSASNAVPAKNTRYSLQGKSKALRSAQKFEKFLEKKKKKSFFDVKTTMQLGSIVKPLSNSKIMGPDHLGKLHTYNTILHRNIVELMNTGYISEELENLNVPIIGVRLTSDMVSCRVYWQASGSVDNDEEVQEVLDRFAPKVRHALIDLHILGKTPKVMFIRDRGAVNAAAVEKLLEVADLGPPDEEILDDETQPHLNSNQMNEQKTDVLGLDRDSIHQKIKDNKEDVKPVEGFFHAGDIKKDLKKFKTDLRKKKEYSQKKALRKVSSLDIMENEDENSDWTEDYWSEEDLEEEIEYDDRDTDTERER